MEIKLNVSEEIAKELLEKYGEESWKPWRAKNGEYYWVEDLEADFCELYELNSKFDNHRYLIGNYHKTEEQAEQASEINRAKGRLRMKMLELNEGWTPDWGNRDQDKYHPYYKHPAKNWETSCNCQNQNLVNYYFSSRELAKQFIKEMKADLNLVINI